MGTPVVKIARIDVRTETEIPRGWAYAVAMHREDGGISEHRVTLNWADHEYWSGGKLPPSRVIEMVLRFLVARRVKLPPAFDAARARRWAPEIDREFRQDVRDG